MLTISKSAVDYIVINSVDTIIHYCRIVELVESNTITNLLNELLEITFNRDKYYINLKNIVAVRTFDSKRITIYFMSGDYIMLNEPSQSALNLIMAQVS